MVKVFLIKTGNNFKFKLFNVGERRSRVKKGDKPDESPESSIESPVSTVESPVSTVESPVSTVESPVSTVESPESTVESPVSTIEEPSSSEVSDDPSSSEYE